MTDDSAPLLRPHQLKLKTKTAGRAYSADTVVLEAALHRIFPLDEDSLFDELIFSIDIADEEQRKRRPGQDAPKA